MRKMIAVALKAGLLLAPVAVLTACGTTDASGAVDRGQSVVQAPGGRSLIVHYTGDPATILEAARTRGAAVFYDLRQSRLVALKVRDGDDVDREIAFYETLPGVNGVTRDGVSTTQTPSTH